ncbi:helix-turn-helix domain-containing protein [Brevundimonas sp. NPDC055814]|uniref:helix-turn-helix domain-containing protein n=1 Tax=Brevundimonas olei TaxID=657642 RepID=UPI003BAF9ECC
MPITQGELADMLGLQRTSINALCRHLQDRGAVQIRPARIRTSFGRRPAIATPGWRRALWNGASATG